MRRSPPPPTTTPSFRFLSLTARPSPSLHVGSSLRLHFSCLGSLLSSPANKSSANLLPESLCPCSNCSGPPLRGNSPEEEEEGEGQRELGASGCAGRERASGGGRRKEEEEEGTSGLEALPNGHPLCRNSRLLSLSVFQPAS